jgi:hypothetical protein
VKTLPPLRAALAASAVALACASTSAGAGERPAALEFTQLPKRAIAGQSVTVTVASGKANAKCALAVKYANGVPQSGLGSKIAVDGQLSWSWTIPTTAQAATAHVNVACGAKKISGRLLVVGSLAPARLSVVNDGFSVKPASYGSGNDVNFGVIIKNSSTTTDALNVTVNVNFVLADDHLLGTKTESISEIPAGQTYDLGDDLSFPGAAPIARLELVMQVGSTQPHTGHALALDNVVIEPNTTNSAWVNDIAGEVINNDPVKGLQSVTYSAVILDGAGNVIGGANGSSYGSIPAGTRVVFKLTSGGVGDVAMSQAASVLVTATPAWQTTGG